jgi:hypothetical protein
VLALLLIVARVGLALDITTNDGRTFKECTVTKVEPDALRIMHTEGAARIPYEKLPTALQKQYFDAAKVAAYRAEVAEAKRIADEAAAAKAAEERRQRAIAAAKAEEERQQAEESRQRAEETRQREEDEMKASAQKAELLRHLDFRKRSTVALGLLGVAALLCVFLYFLPTVIGRHKANALAIFVMNFFLGWTFIGWIVALIWACTEDSAMERLARERMNAPPDPSLPPRPYLGREPLREHESLPDREGRYLE